MNKNGTGLCPSQRSSPLGELQLSAAEGRGWTFRTNARKMLAAKPLTWESVPNWDISPTKLPLSFADFTPFTELIFQKFKT